MFECRYCGNIFEKLTDIGACPACGGPKPKRLQPEVRTMIVDRYVYMPATARSPEYYTPPQRTFKQQAYGTLGYKLVAGFTVLTVAAFVVWFAYFWFFYRNSDLRDSNPALRNTVPTAISITVTPNVSSNPWLDGQWLTSQEALGLREQTNVINLALLTNGQAKYRTDSLVFDRKVWIQFRPFGLTEASVSGTTVALKINGEHYFLNIYQPFIIEGQWDYVYVVDETGRVWRIAMAQANLVDLPAAQNSLPVIITPNEDLSLSY
ncbi:hypothetical protein COY48_04510 [Candidatus Collierbacteria bacterium CG_4_10_14_0_8_um_filter_43_86]|uniref:Rubredoxin-like domain-containing protein n=1 Tax=Candidatus Collierbacteria bacterium CG_4_9_14_3_um_filter_43_16 TaxID=1974532 RepID=A0A2M8BTL6_9BACT|nr:MAG: hypothetical protein COY48_04510 [Candidatus Collierbacteria bacterium CG_4_10_14_0_8_um_filter_43_86]PJB47208.1 MAG: hypothetical protein CO104_04185 [Candidatus Collierbacteria bacterium CG_4_9_14_3_um_filter_43_16]